jgi:hypothetical protein
MIRLVLSLLLLAALTGCQPVGTSPPPTVTDGSPAPGASLSPVAPHVELSPQPEPTIIIE